MSPRLTLGAALAADDKTLARDMLLADRFAEFIPPADLDRWIEGALAAGQAAADALGSIPPSGINDLVQRQGIAIRVEPARQELGMVMFASTYEPSPPTITLYQATLDVLRELIEKRGLAGLGDLESICIAHEWFHHLDRTSPAGSVAGRWRVTTFCLGPFRQQATVGSAVEIAAHSFARALLDLPRWPGILDYMMLYR